jgi:hypothetical protein
VAEEEEEDEEIDADAPHASAIWILPDLFEAKFKGCVCAAALENGSI